MARMTGGQAIVRTLMDHDVDVVFGIPGIQLDFLFDALFEKKQQVRTLHARHEQGCAYMALGYAQASGKVGACLVVPGPGVLNTLAALSTAAAANAPVLCLTGQIPSHQIGLGLGMAHEIRDQLQTLRGVVKWAGRAETPEAGPAVMREAFRQMLSSRHQPVSFEMAPDMMGKTAEIEILPAETGYAEPPVDADKIAAAAKLLAGAKAPAIFVGGGVFGAEAVLQEIAELLDAPVIMGRTARGALSDRHRLAAGMLEGQELWPQIDVALAVGTRFVTQALSWGRDKDVKVIRIDIDAEQAVKPRAADIVLATGAKSALPALLKALQGANGARPGRQAALDAAKRLVQDKLGALEPQRSFARVLREELPDDAFVVTDVTQMGYYTQYGMPFYQPRTCITTSYQATLGFAMPTAFGAQVAFPDRKVVAICGDGGFMFNVQEMATAVAHNIPVVTIVFADGAYGNVKKIQKEGYGARHIAVDLTNPDFVTLAKSFGMLGIKADGPDALRAALREAFAARGPALIHVPVGELPDIWKLVQRPPSQGPKPN